MPEGVDIDRPVVKWGNSYGVRLTQAELKRLGIQPGDRVRGHLTAETTPNDLDKVRFLSLGLPANAQDLERLLDEDLLKDEAE